VGPKQERVTINELLDGLENDYKLRDKWSAKVASNVKPLREHFGTWRAVDVTSNAIGTYIENLREQGYSNATANRRTQLVGQAFKVGFATSNYRLLRSSRGCLKSATRGRDFSRRRILKRSFRTCPNTCKISAGSVL